MSDRAWVYITSSATKFSDFKHIVGKPELLRADYYTKIFCFVSTMELQTLYIQELPYMNTFCELHLEKNQTYGRTFPVQLKEISKCR